MGRLARSILLHGRSSPFSPSCVLLVHLPACWRRESLCVPPTSLVDTLGASHVLCGSWSNDIDASVLDRSGTGAGAGRWTTQRSSATAARGFPSARHEELQDAIGRAARRFPLPQPSPPPPPRPQHSCLIRLPFPIWIHLFSSTCPRLLRKCNLIQASFLQRRCCQAALSAMHHVLQIDRLDRMAGQAVLKLPRGQHDDSCVCCDLPLIYYVL